MPRRAKVSAFLARSTVGIPYPLRRAFTMVEAVLSVIIVSVLLVGALNTVGASGWSQRKSADRARGMLLAQDLMSEILQQAYKDPDVPTVTLGREGNEQTLANRSLYDDVDDYAGWSASPPQRKNGSVIEGFDDWGRSVAVEWVNPDNLGQVVGSDTQVKRITVTVTRDRVPVACLVAIRTGAWSGGGSGPGGGGDPSNKPPKAVALAVPTSGLAPLTVQFFAGASSDRDGDTLTYLWAFGDGGTSTSETTTHTYSQGTYVVTLTVSDGRGGVDTDTLDIDVEDD